MKKAMALVMTISILIGVSGCNLGGLVSRAPTATPTPTRTPKPTFTPLPTDTPTPEAPPTATNTPVVVATDTPTLEPSPTAMATATNTPVPPPAPTSPPPPPTATSTPTHTPTAEVYPCSYVPGSKTGSAAGNPDDGLQPSSVFSGYLIDAAGNPLNGYGVYCEHPFEGPVCVESGDAAAPRYWAPGAWKIEYWSPAKPGYYLTIKESCLPGARALSIREDFEYKNWLGGKHEKITFRCNF